jgi:hypothetical protein
MTTTTTRLLLAGAAMAAAVCLKPPAAHAFGNAPWCAMIELGNDDTYWDCQYRTVEECIPHILAGNRGSCNVNPWPGPQAAPAHTAMRKRHVRHHHSQ